MLIGPSFIVRNVPLWMICYILTLFQWDCIQLLKDVSLLQICSTTQSHTKLRSSLLSLWYLIPNTNSPDSDSPGSWIWVSLSGLVNGLLFFFQGVGRRMVTFHSKYPSFTLCSVQCHLWITSDQLVWKLTEVWAPISAYVRLATCSLTHFYWRELDLGSWLWFIPSFIYQLINPVILESH